MGLLATVFKPEHRYIGRCGLYPNRDDDNAAIPREAVLAYYLARPYWGRGLATEAGRAFVEYGFTKLGRSRIVAGANAANIASNRVLVKLGFVWVRSGEGGGNSWHDDELRNPYGTSLLLVKAGTPEQESRIGRSDALPSLCLARCKWIGVGWRGGTTCPCAFPTPNLQWIGAGGARSPDPVLSHAEFVDILDRRGRCGAVTPRTFPTPNL
jgi:Acetyltransferase (GNAT) domain